ncbi:hypothetical protein G6O67_008318 [Ophiocordyceps sinensis]|uniref:Transmembrane protein n=1 Tax=Ophiocordyceps sinensis TaxID=72228 RepID=A0A8H4LR96_9HYPO|nr:hypothetical protein G6O67_008886 [Ophiocordyceps sinensis]KAF4504930.1 hypothetical protein G6O67_008318 [Ophiocordyceps sinensis]
MAADAAETPSWAVKDLLTPPSSWLVRAISVICLALGTLIILPVVFCVGYDFILWIWRQWSNVFSTPEALDAPTPAPGDDSARPPPTITTSNDAQGQTSSRKQ